jgi:hypothetical protein
MISPTALAPQLAEYLPRQRWFGAKDRKIDFVRIRSTEVLSGEGEWPVLLRVDAEVHLEGTDDARYQVFLGLRPTGVDLDFLSGHETAVLGEFDTAQGSALVYDALLDSELALTCCGSWRPTWRPSGCDRWAPNSRTRRWSTTTT